MRLRDPRPKILVEIYSPDGYLIKKGKFPIVGNGTAVEIRPPGKGPGQPAYRPKFDKDCKLTYMGGIWPFKSLKQKLMLIDGANHCIRFRKKGVDPAVWDREAEEELFKASVIKAAGATVQKMQIPATLYVFLFILFILSLIQILIMTGRLRI